MDLNSLETMLLECNNPVTSSDRRREIEAEIFRFDELDNSWHFYLHILSQPNMSDYSQHLALSLLEGKVTKRWALIPAEGRLAIRSGICRLVQQVVDCKSPLTRQHFFVKKLLQLCADIARNDWPHDYSDFMDSVFQLCSSGELYRAKLGFIFLRIVSEEFTDERALATSQRRLQLKGLLEQLLPQVSQLIASALHSWNLVSSDDQFGEVALEALSCLSHFLTWAPLHLLFGDNQHYKLSNVIFHIFANGFIASMAAASSDPKKRTAALSVLGCVSELFGRHRCLPKDVSVVLDISSLFFQMIDQVVIPPLEEQRHDSSSFTESSNSILENITNCLSTFFTTCFTPVILNHPDNRDGILLKDVLVLLARYTLAQPDTDTLCGCLDIWGGVLESLVSTVSQNVLSSIESSVLEFAQRLLVRAMFTTNQRELDELDDDVDSGFNSNLMGSSKASLSTSEAFDNSNCDFDGIFGDNAERDYQLADGDGSDLPKAERFFVGVSVVIREIAIAYPKAVIGDLLLKSTQDRATFFVEVTQHLQPERILDSNVRAVDAARIHCASRDLATLVSLVAGVADLIDPTTGFSVFSSLAVLTNQSCHLVGLAAPNSKTSPLREDLVRLHSRLFASLRAVFVHIARPMLLGALSTPKTTSDEMSQQLTQTIIGAINAAVHLIIANKAPEVLQSSIPFLYACLTCRIPSISTSQSFCPLHPFLAADPTSENVLNLVGPSLRIQLCSGLIASQILPHAEVRDPQQDWAGRSNALSALFAQMIAPYFDINFMNYPNNEASGIRLKWLKNSLRLVTAVCRLVSIESPQSRQLVVNCIIMGPIEHNNKASLLATCLALTPMWQRASDIDGTLALLAFLSAVVNLQAQVDPQEMDKLIQTVMDSFPPSIVCANLLAPASSNRQSEHQLVAAFISILRHVFEKGDFASGSIQKRNRVFLTGAIRYCLEDLRPAIAANQSVASSVLPAFIALLETIVADNWNFFSRKFGSFSSGMGSLIDEVDRLEEAHYAYLVGIIETLFSSLLLPDIEVVRRAVGALNRIDNRCRLFSRHFFSTSPAMLGAVLSTLLAALEAGAHDILRDDILTLMHSILDKAQLNQTDQKPGFSFFFQSVLPSYVSSHIPDAPTIVHNLLSSLLPVPNNALPTDQPSFIVLMSRFLIDFRYHVAILCKHTMVSSIPNAGWLVSVSQTVRS